MSRKVRQAVNRIGRPVFCPDRDKSGREHYLVLLPTSNDIPAFHFVEPDALLRTSVTAARKKPGQEGGNRRSTY